jgi:2-oxoglutarate dehydrogenase E2 component (dihydrolipoamide succinyltransferase)
MSVELRIPSVGESVTEALIAQWLKSEGDRVEKDEPLAELETDKVTVELPAPVAGVLVKIARQEGETVSVGDVIGLIAEGDGAGAGAAKREARPAEQPTAAVAPSSASAPPAAAPRTAPPAPAAESPIAAHVKPSARRALAEQGPDAQPVREDDDRDFKRDAKKEKDRDKKERKRERKAEEEAERAVRRLRERAAAQPRAEEVVPMTPMRKRIAERLVAAQQAAALLTTFNEIDMSAVMSLRQKHRDAFEKRHGVKLGFMSFFVKAAIDALRQFPQVNAEVRGTDIVYRSYYDIGMAVSTDRGLLVPVLRNAETMSFAEVEQAIGDFAERARAGKIRLEELEGGTFTITNGGVFGSMLSTPIVNPPQSGVLGLHAIEDRPIARDGQVVIHPMMYVALSYDHRIVDGREAVTFLRRIKEAIEDPTRILLET